MQLRMAIIRNVTIPPNGSGLFTVTLMIVHTFEEEIFEGKNAILIAFTIEIIHSLARD